MEKNNQVNQNNKYADLFKQALLNLESDGELEKIRKWVGDKSYTKDINNTENCIWDKKNRIALVDNDSAFANTLDMYGKEKIPFIVFLNNVKSPDVFRSLLLEIYTLLNSQEDD